MIGIQPGEVNRNGKDVTPSLNLDNKTLFEKYTADGAA
jgi:hypothetical protein